MDRVAITNRVAEVVSKANKIFPSLNLEVPKVSFFSKGRRAGTAYCFSNRLEFNEVLAKDNGSGFDFIVVHEVSHLVTTKMYPNAKQNHGPEFKAIDRCLGGRGTTYHNLDVSKVSTKKTKTRYELACPCMSHWVTKKTYEAVKNPRKIARCNNCKSPVEPTGKVKTFK